MRFRQRRFFAYPSGAPSLHTLSSVSSHSYTLVTTDRCVSFLGYGDAGYNLHKLEVGDLRAGKVDVMASAAIERPATLQSQVAVACAVGDALYLQVLTFQHESLGSGEAPEPASCGKFDLEAAPTCMFSVHAAGTSGDVFRGVMVCCIESMTAFGYIENEKESSTSESSAVCARLDSEQFAVFFPELATFSHTILAVDVFISPEKDQGWVAFGCADGLVRVFHGNTHGGCLGGPFKTKDLQLNGPVTSVALFPKQTISIKEATSSWFCNLLVTCAIGQAVVFEDLYSTTDLDRNGEVLMDSDTFDSIFAGVTADIDLDGDVELLLGTDSQVMLAYKGCAESDNSYEAIHEDTTKISLEPRANEATLISGNVSPTSPDSLRNIWSDVETIAVGDHDVHPSASLARRRKWQRLSRSRWDLETFGSIYSLLWRDVNHDGVPELLIASSTGIYVYEADPIIVIDKLEHVLEALHMSA